MTPFVRTGLLLALLALASGCQQEPLRWFSPEEDGFSVRMPGTPTKIVESAAGIDFTSYVVRRRSGAMIVSFSGPVVPADASEEDVEKRLESARDGLVRSYEAKLKGDRDKALLLDNKYPGRRLEATLPGDKRMIRARIYLVNGRWYQLAVVGFDSYVGSETATEFLESFQPPS